MRITALIMMGLALRSICGAGDLKQELDRRSATEGLAIIALCGEPPEALLLPPGMEMRRVNPRSGSCAYPVHGGDIVAWKIYHFRDFGRGCGTDPLVIESPSGTELWRVPEQVITGGPTAVSPNAKLVVFWGSYLPVGQRPNQTRAVYGLHLAVRGAAIATLIPSPEPKPPLYIIEPPTTEISWAPDGHAFVYDDHEKIYLYDFASGQAQQIAGGKFPEWSPDGKWISFRSPNGTATVLDAGTLAPHDVFGHYRVQAGIHWSPDAQYVFLSTSAGLLSQLWHLPDIFYTGDFLVIRVRDRAVTKLGTTNAEGWDDRHFFWISDYRAFVAGADLQPHATACISQ